MYKSIILKMHSQNFFEETIFFYCKKMYDFFIIVKSCIQHMYMFVDYIKLYNLVQLNA